MPTKTWLKPTQSFRIDGYSCERHDGSSGKERGGGVATFVRDGLSDSVLHKTDETESLSIGVMTVQGYKLVVTNVYHPPE